MKKKLAALLCGILCVSLLAAPVYAADGRQPGNEPAITITEGDVSGGEVMTVAGGVEPISVTSGMVDGVPTLTKVYELPQGVNTDALTTDFEQGGIAYTVRDISSAVQPGQNDTKTVTQTETLETESKKPSEIAAEAAPTLAYSADGYTGQLALDVGAITVEENGSSSYRHRIEDVREYTNLDRNDAAYVPKTVLKNGATLQLESIEWVVMGQHPVDGRMVPNLFTAVATYAGVVTGSRADGYTATLTYSGTVTKTLPGKTVFTMVFYGEVMNASDSSAASDGTLQPGGANGENDTAGKTPSLLLTILLSIVAAGFLAISIVSLIRRRREARESDSYSDNDGDFICGDGFSGDDFNPNDYAGFADENRTGLSAEEYGGGDDYSEPPPAHYDYDEEDAQVTPQQAAPQQKYPQDEFDLDSIFNEEGYFNG